MKKLQFLLLVNNCEWHAAARLLLRPKKRIPLALLDRVAYRIREVWYPRTFMWTSAVAGVVGAVFSTIAISVWKGIQ